MCIIIDTNALALVFQKHSDFMPILKWVYKRNGFIVYGGTKYIYELKKTRYVRVFRLLKESHKAREVNRAKVDQREREIIKMTIGSDCDDQHIIAILNVSGCRILCSLDQRSYKYVKDKRFYSKREKRPYIYRSIKNKSLLRDANIIQLQNSL